MRTLALVFGAGKTSRGFIAHLLSRSGYSTTFVDIDRALVARLNERRQYTVHVLGAPEEDTVITGVSALALDDPELIAVGRRAGVIYVSVGGPNLEAVAEPLALILSARLQDPGVPPVNIIVCENWTNAGAKLRANIEKWLFGVTVQYGVAEATVMRSSIGATSEQLAADPLALQVQNFWELEVDADGLVPPIPEVFGMHPVPLFQHALVRKLFTYNMANATISYLGWLRGYSVLSEAANDADILATTCRAQSEANEAIVREFGYDRSDQAAFAERALRKFQDRAIVDPLARQVRDPIRKLGRTDRLVGPAHLALAHHIPPRGIAMGIAAALLHRNSTDEHALQLTRMVEREGALSALCRVAQLDPDEPLVAHVNEALTELEECRVDRRGSH